MKILKTYSIKLAMLVLLLIGMNQHSDAAEEISIARIDNYGLSVNIEFYSNGIDATTIDAITLYEAEGFTNDKNDFKKIRDYDFTDYPLLDTGVYWTGKLNSIATLKWSNFPNDKDMSYYLTFTKGIVESDIPDTTYYYNETPKDSIVFANRPPYSTTLLVGETMNFDASAGSLKGNTLNYKLVDSPNDDAEVNKETGGFELLSSAVGNFTYTVRAYDINNEDKNYSDLKIKVKVYSCFTTIDGIITINNKIPEALVRGSVDIYKIKNDSASIEFSTAVLSDGSFTASLDQGTYKIRFNGYFDGKQITAWYDAKTGITDADEIMTTCDNTTNIAWDIDYTNTSNFSIVMDKMTPDPYEFVIKGNTFEREIEYTTSPANQDVIFTLSSVEHFELTGANNNILKLKSSESGFYNVLLLAKMKDQKSVTSSQIVRVWITECDNLNKLTVKVKDNESGNSLTAFAKANLFYLDTISISDSVQYYSIKIDSVSSSNGNFEFNVDAGTYFLELYTDGTVNGTPVSYRYIYNFDEPTNNNPNVTNGEIIEMACENKTLHWDIRTPKEIRQYKLGGTVTDEETGLVIEFAKIEVVSKNKLTDEISATYAYTNDNGHYTMDLDNASLYTVSAISDIDSLDLIQYTREYWDETNNPLEATIIDFNSDETEINFTLTEKPEYENRLYGNAIDEDDLGVEGVSIIAYLVETTAFDSELLYWNAATTTDSEGNFEFENLTPGKYIVYAYYSGRKYKPGYYKSSSDMLELSWLNATKIEVEETGDFGDLPIRLSPMKSITSNKRLTGIVNRLKSVASGSNTTTDPLNGVSVLVTNNDGEVMNYSNSDVTGNFKVPNLEVGEFKVYFDKVGYELTEQEIQIDTSDITYIEANLQPLTTTTVPTFESVNGSVYPNPSSGFVNITGDFKAGNYVAKVSDMTGNVLIIRTIELNSNTSYNLNLSTLSSGQYLIQLVGNNDKYTIKVNLIK